MKPRRLGGGDQPARVVDGAPFPPGHAQNEGPPRTRRTVPSPVPPHGKAPAGEVAATDAKESKDDPKSTPR
jgi:hypothetical protein